MRVLNEAILQRHFVKHPDSRDWLQRWLETARTADWSSITSVRQTYPAADGGVRVASGARVTVFDVGGNKHRLITNIVYPIRTVSVLEVMTHAEYSKNRWKKRY